MRPDTLLRAHFVLILPLLSACSGIGRRGGDYRVYETAGGQEIELERMVRELSDVDVVFLGEEHDNDAGHRLQLWTFEMLLELRGDLILSLEQFEADVQPDLDLYLAGAIDEQTFLSSSRPWGNYDQHYRSVVEAARRENLPVLAANIPRPVARQVAYEGLYSVGNLRIAPWTVWVEEPDYARRFARAMGHNHMPAQNGALQRWFAAQCIKDEKMAQSIEQAVEAARAEGRNPLVVHLCGKFHSDYRLGTVSRLQRRMPDLELRVVGMNSDEVLRRKLGADEREQGDYVWLVKPQ
jgi:uncharacterized iron-regulated protein